MGGSASTRSGPAWAKTTLFPTTTTPVAIDATSKTRNPMYSTHVIAAVLVRRFTRMDHNQLIAS